jgi:type IV conjugative transfer system protein TraL
MEKKRFPQYLSSPYQVLWMESDELAIFLIFLILALVFSSWLLVVLMCGGPYVYSVLKKKYPRGFLRHVLYFTGLISMRGYPSFFESDFME